MIPYHVNVNIVYLIFVRLIFVAAIDLQKYSYNKYFQIYSKF